MQSGWDDDGDDDDVDGGADFFAFAASFMFHPLMNFFFKPA